MQSWDGGSRKPSEADSISSLLLSTVSPGLPSQACGFMFARSLLYTWALYLYSRWELWERIKGKGFFSQWGFAFHCRKNVSLLIGQNKGNCGIEKFSFSASVAKDVNHTGNWELCKGRQSVGSATVLSSEKCTHMCRSQFCQVISAWGGSFLSGDGMGVTLFS